jgi:hypothetical protein
MVPAMRACYFTMKIDPSVILDPEPAVATEPSPTIDDFPDFTWRYKPLLDAFMSTKRTEVDRRCRLIQTDLIANYSMKKGELHPLTNLPAESEAEAEAEAVPVRPMAERKIALKFFQHVTAHASRLHDHEDGLLLKPKDCFDLEVSKLQLRLLNPIPYDVLLGSIMDETLGAKSKKKIPKRRINFISCNPNSYCRSMNNPAALAQVEEAAELAGVLGGIRTEIDDKKTAAKNKKKKKDRQKRANKRKRNADLKKKKKELLPEQQEHLSKGMVHVKTLSNTILKGILRYRFDVPGTAQMDKATLLSGIEERLASVTANPTTPAEEEQSDSESGQSNDASSSSEEEEDEAPQEGL